MLDLDPCPHCGFERMTLEVQSLEDRRPDVPSHVVRCDNLYCEATVFGNSWGEVQGKWNRRAPPKERPVVKDRAYRVAEIEALRRACSDKFDWGRFGGPNWEEGNFCGRQYRPDQKAREVEEMIRTHMLAGHTAEELIASDPK